MHGAGLGHRPVVLQSLLAYLCVALSGGRRNMRGCTPTRVNSVNSVHLSTRVAVRCRRWRRRTVIMAADQCGVRKQLSGWILAHLLHQHHTGVRVTVYVLLRRDIPDVRTHTCLAVVTQRLRHQTQGLETYHELHDLGRHLQQRRARHGATEPHMHASTGRVQSAGAGGVSDECCKMTPVPCSPRAMVVRGVYIMLLAPTLAM